MYIPSYQPLNQFIEDSSIELPRFQRKKTWKNSQKFDLALSIYSGYPMGVVILYKEHEHSKTRYLLDGRQRRDAATEIYYNPSALMEWAFKELKLSKKKGGDKKEQVLLKFATRISDYIEQEPSIEDEDSKDDLFADDQIENYEEDDESEVEDDDSEENSEEDVSYEATSNNNDGFSCLRDMIVIAWTNRTGKNDGLCAPFELSKYFGERTPSYYADYSKKKINGAELRKFLMRYKEDYPGDKYKDVNNFLDYIRLYVDPKKEQALMNERLSGFWEDMLKIIELLSDLELRIKNAKISTIDVSDMSMTDAQKIFNLINTGGTQLTAVEVLSAKPGWTDPVKDPSPELINVTNMLYKELGIDNKDTVVKWDVAASFIRRIKHINIVFPVSPNDNAVAMTKQATLGFQLLSGVYKESITKVDYETLNKKKEIDWSEGIDELVGDFGKLLELVSDTDYFYIFSSWKTSLSKVLSDGCALDFLLELYFDWQRKGKPTNKSDSAYKAFKRNIFIVTDRLFYEYYIGLWKGSGDSRISSNIKSIQKIEDKNSVLDHIDKSLWSKLINEAFDISMTRKSYSEYAPLLFHFVCLNRIKAQNMEDAKSASIDHIIPQSAWKYATVEKKREKMDNLSNLALVDSKINSVKNDKELTKCQDEEQYVIDSIVAYEGINSSDFEKYSNPVYWEDLHDERLDLYIKTFIGDKDKKSARDKYLEEVY